MENMILSYIRVGSTYYKKIKKPQADGTVQEVLKKWSRTTLMDDLKAQEKSVLMLSAVPKYDDFVYLPSHTDFKQSSWNCYNRYHKISHEPKQGKWNSIETFLRHIFGEQYEVGLDYFQLLYLNPRQKLPVVCLVSKEKGTGKTTFVKFVSTIFEDNVLKISNDSFSSNFNADWNGKLIIALEEIKFEKNHLINKIKDLTTSHTFQLEKKGLDRETEAFFAKFIINSNHENDFIKVEDEDNRFWIRDIPKFEKEDVNLLDKMKEEIPYFLDHLKNRSIKHKNESRFWFSKEVTWTDALRRIRQSSRSKTQFVIASSLVSALEGVDTDEIKFTVSDLPNLITSPGFRFNDPEIRKMLKQEWKLKPANNTLIYRKVIKHPDGSYYQSDAKGRYFTVTKKFLSENFDDLMN